MRQTNANDILNGAVQHPGKAEFMTRPEFLSALIGGAAAVRAVAETERNGEPSKKKRLLAIQYEGYLDESNREKFRAALRPYEQRYGIEFMILDRTVRILDPEVVA